MYSIALVLVLVKCYDNKMVKSPYNWVIYPLTQPQMANQQQQKKKLERFEAGVNKHIETRLIETRLVN